jgi:hypothetical protein
MPTTTYEALKIIKVLGLSCDSIHAYTNGCVFFRDALKIVQQCPKCSTNKFVEGLVRTPHKVLQHFPLIPWLVRMYKCKYLAQLLIWHKNGISSDGLVCCVLDSMNWKHINDIWPDFVVIHAM